jgi:hypothetical protein
MDTVLTMGALLLIVIIWFDLQPTKEVGSLYNKRTISCKITSTSNNEEAKKATLLQEVRGIKKLNHPSDKRQQYFPLLKGLEYNPAV